MSGLLYRIWEQYFSKEESCTDISLMNDPYTVTVKWWPVMYPESERTEIVSDAELLKSSQEEGSCKK